ncbi:MAG TPA: hypothetical protein VHW74_08015 [Mycobacteriales bacterium]|nr:hypothetical protein [Mycobacteriales bacterium]
MVLLGTSCATASAQTISQPSIRGSELSGFSCHGHVIDSTDAAPPQQVTAFRLCPLEYPGQAGRTVTVRPGNAHFARLRTALAAPDQQPKRDQVCAMYANLPQRVLAQTTSGVVLVHIPTDSCGHYQSAAALALAAARE